MKKPCGKPFAAKDAVSTEAETGLYSEAGVIEGQARQIQPLDEGENLLRAQPATAMPPKGQRAGGRMTMQKLRWRWDSLRSSLWFLPALMIAGEVALALALIEADTRLSPGELERRWPWLFGAGARRTLSAIAGSMITVAGVAFSITVVAPTLASSQYISRILRNFMRDRANQAVLGVFTGVVLHAVLLLSLCCGALMPAAKAQEPEGKAIAAKKQPAPNKEELPPAPAKVDVKPVARDEEIRKRLQSVLDATGWFTDPQVRVEEGVVFLNGGSQTDELKKWATDMARNTQDVVAVANRIEVFQPSPWDFSESLAGLTGLWRDFLRFLPLLAIGLLILALSAGAGWMATRGAQAFLRRRIRAKLLRSVFAYGIGFFVFLAGIYIILRVSGLTQLALTVVGGTGLIGLAVGIAFRDITENFLASLFLSMQQPFGTGDLIEVAGVTGFVQQLNVRTTIVMSLDGNLVQIPNALVYKSTLRNFTANPNRRESFVVGIGYDDPIDEAQEVARKVLADHPAVLNDPEPWVLADGLGSATVNLRIYFWLNGKEHSWLKVRSSVIRLVKRAFQEHGISMPDEAREVVFPRGLPVTLLDQKRETTPSAEPPNLPQSSPLPVGRDTVSTKAEAGLSSEAGALEDQARQAKPLDAEENLLGNADGGRRSP